MSAGTYRSLGNVEGKVALITGGSRGIGFACAQELIAGGARVAITGRDEAVLAEAKAKLGERATAIAGDATSVEAAAACVKQVTQIFGGIDILVNNAGGPLKFGPLMELPLDHFEATLNRNLTGPLMWVRQAWDAAMSRKGGAVVNIASLGGLTLQPHMGAYCVAKAGLIHLTKALAAELGPGVRVNAIASGLVETDSTSAVIGTMGEPPGRRLPMERLGQPEDIARTVRFLASDDAAWITGETVIVDGGALIQWGKTRRGDT